MYISNGFN